MMIIEPNAIRLGVENAAPGGRALFEGVSSLGRHRLTAAPPAVYRASGFFERDRPEDAPLRSLAILDRSAE